MRTAFIALNGFATVFSLVWLIGHATVRVGDWEFWFALGYLGLAAGNVAYLVRTRS